MSRRPPRRTSFWIEWAQGMAVVTVGVPPTVGIGLFLVSRFALVTTPPPTWTGAETLLPIWAAASGLLLAGCAGILYAQLSDVASGTLHASELVGFSPFRPPVEAFLRMQDVRFTPVGEWVVVDFALEDQDGTGRRGMHFATVPAPVLDTALAAARERAPGWGVEVVDDRVLAWPHERRAEGPAVTDADRLTFLHLLSALG